MLTQSRALAEVLAGPISHSSLQWVTYFYLTRAPRAVSSQGMQDQSGAKSGNWLVEFVYVVSTSFMILFSQNQFEASSLSLRSCTAFQNWKSSS